VSCCSASWWLPVNACSATAQVISSTDPEIHKAEVSPIPLKFVSVAHSYGRELDVILKKAVFECLLD